MLSYLDQNLKYAQRKYLIKAIFEKIIVRNRQIVNARLNMPFSLFLGDKLKKLFDNPPLGGTKEDVFEQMFRFTLSGKYAEMKELISQIEKENKPLSEMLKAA